MHHVVYSLPEPWIDASGRLIPQFSGGKSAAQPKPAPPPRPPKQPKLPKIQQFKPPPVPDPPARVEVTSAEAGGTPQQNVRRRAGKRRGRRQTLLTGETGGYLAPSGKQTLLG